MNLVILPGVKLVDLTVVAVGSVVGKKNLKKDIR